MILYKLTLFKDDLLSSLFSDDDSEPILGPWFEESLTSEPESKDSTPTAPPPPPPPAEEKKEGEKQDGAKASLPGELGDKEEATEVKGTCFGSAILFSYMYALNFYCQAETVSWPLRFKILLMKLCECLSIVLKCRDVSVQILIWF